MSERMDALRLAAGVTDKEYDAMRLWNPGVVGYRSVGLALGISREAARDRINNAKRKIAACDVEL